VHRDLQPRLVAALGIALDTLAWSAVLGLAVRFVIRHLNPHEETLRSAAVAIWFAPATILILQFSLVGIASGLALVVSATRLLCPPRMRPAIGMYVAGGVIASGELVVGRLARYFVLSILISAGFQAAIVAFVMGRRLPAALLLTMSAAMLTALATSVGAWTQDRPPDLPRSIMGLAVTVLLALALGRGGGGSGWGLGLGPDWTLSFHSGSGAGAEETPPPAPRRLRRRRRPPCQL